jgi:hypothetical protein
MPFLFINQTETIGVILSAGTSTLTGSMVATLLFILLFLMTMAFMFGIPLEFLAVIILPFCIACVTVYGNFWLPIVVIILFVGSIIAKNWLFK